MKHLLCYSFILDIYRAPFQEPTQAVSERNDLREMTLALAGLGSSVSENKCFKFLVEDLHRDMMQWNFGDFKDGSEYLYRPIDILGDQHRCDKAFISTFL